MYFLFKIYRWKKMNRKERFKNRKKRLEKIKNTTVINDDVDERLVQEFLTSKVDSQRIEESCKTLNEHYIFKYNIDVSKEEAQELLNQFKEKFTQEKFDKLISDCKKEVITSIVTPFGLGKVIAVYDKVGGNVDTVHNVRDGIYATEDAKKTYENRGDYNTHEYHSHQHYRDINKTNSKLKESGELKDYMTGNTIERYEKSDLDHIISAKEIHDDAGRVLANKDGADLANTNTNLKATSSTSNRSKKADSMSDFISRKDENLKEIEVLKSKDILSHQEKNRVKKLEELQKIDNEKALKADKDAREAYNKNINKTYYTSQEFVKNTVTTGASEGVKMGMQQALGLVMTEFFTALFDEILDIYKNGYSNGFGDDKFFTILKERLKRIALKIKDKWKNVATIFKDGFLSGFISNLVTTVINAFVTTGKRVVRIIREGICSLFKAVKLLLFPPKGMSFEDAMHEAKKLIASGLIISLGIIAEEYIDKLIRGTGALSPFADILTTVFVGAITGLAVTMVVYHIDKKKNNKEMINTLISQTDKKLDNVEKLLAELELIRVM